MGRFTLLAEDLDVTSVEVLKMCLWTLSILSNVHIMKTHHGPETVNWLKA